MSKKTEYVIETENLTRYFKKKCVVDQVNLKIPKGGVYGLLGRNGAGKSTTLRIALGMLEPTRGCAKLLGCDSREITPEIRGRVGYMSETHAVYRWMKVHEVARYQEGTFPRWNQDLFETILEHFRVSLEEKVSNLSRGQRGGVCLAATMATEPELLILDDPALGLDPVARRALLQAILFATKTGDRTIVFSSHQLADVERVADSVAVMEQGQLRAACPVETFRASIKRYLLRHEGESPKLPEIDGLLDVFRMPGEVSLTIAKPSDAIEKQLQLPGVTDVEEIPLPLEDAFISYVGEREEKSLFMNI